MGGREEVSVVWEGGCWWCGREDVGGVGGRRLV